MTNYATIEDLEAGWRTLSPEESSRAETLLERATLFLDGIVEQYAIDTSEKAGALRAVCCDLVQRKLESASANAVSSVTQTAGAFSETISYSKNGSQSWRLFPEDYRLLGVRTKKVRMVPIAIHDGSGEIIDW